MEFQNLEGQKFGKLTVVSYMGKAKDGHSLWQCKCECKKICKVSSRNLKSGNTKSCGCNRYKNKTLNASYDYIKYKKLYKCWIAIKNRCFCKTSRYYIRYGGRGITVCNEWKNDFGAFKNWALENGYDENARFGECTIDRIDNNGNYEPNNCRWVDKYVQANNKSNNIFITYNNKTQTMAQWAKEYDISPNYLRYKLNKGWDIEKIINKMKEKYNGK